MADAPFDTSLALLLNRSARLSFVQGEDRNILLQVQDADTQSPYDLTGCQAAFAMNRLGGGTLRASTYPLVLPFGTSSLIAGENEFLVPNHGLANGQLVQMQPLAGQALPPPYQDGATYVVNQLTVDSFSLRGTDGRKYGLSGSSGAIGAIYVNNLTISDAIRGEMTLTLSSQVTAAAATGQGLNFQMMLADATGKGRILVGRALLDVSAQPCP